MEYTLVEAKESLKRTKEILPILKQVGVVDSGGQGLVNVYEGMLSVLKGENIASIDDNSINSETYFAKSKEEHVDDEIAEMMSLGTLSVDDIVFRYCTEFMVIRNGVNAKPYNELLFREQLSQFGDSLLVISDDELIKVHIHAEKLDEVLFLAQQYGELTKIKIENMREQFRTRSNSVKKVDKKPVGVVAIGAGEGIKEIFLSLGVDQFVMGGQTMNPSTEDIVKAINAVNAETVFVLPNNSNIIMAAEQSVELANSNVIVIPSKTIQQGLAAMTSSVLEGNIDTITNTMKEAISYVYSGQVTYAVRDTVIDNVVIKKGEYMGIENGKILLSQPGIVEVTVQLIEKMIEHSNGEIVTIISGEDAESNITNQILESIENTFPDVEIEVHTGSQPVYPYLISVE